MNDPQDYDPEYIADLEARLYSQVFHSSEETHIENVLGVTEPTDNLKTSNKQKYRYFETKQTESRPANFIPITEPNVPVFQQDILVCPDSSNQNGCNQIIQNNITVHQYAIPVLYRNPLAKSRGPVKDYLGENGALKKRRKRTKKRKAKQAPPRILQQSNQVIVLSDGSDEDCIIVQNSEAQKQIEKPTPKRDDSDEDIVYIPAAPPDVISLDGDDTSDKVIQNDSPIERSEIANDPVQIPESVASNDFLDGNSVDRASNFNFSLHGADFNAQSNEFARPPNPVENCETESSCSTNDHSREFNNSVKTIVFDEIEFPRGDIFADKSLESFKTFITPQRKIDAQSTPDNRLGSQKDQRRKKETRAQNTTSDSSSESDYEDGSNCNQFDNTEGNKSLPSLSLMLPETRNSSSNEQSEPSKDIAKASEAEIKEQVLDGCVKTTSKLKKKRSKSTEVDSAKDVAEEEIQVHPKKKRGTLEDVAEGDRVVESICTPKVGKKKRSKKSENEDSFMSQVIVIDDSEDIEGRSSAKKKKKRKSFSEKSDNNTKPATILDISGLRDMILIDDIEFEVRDVEEIPDQDLTLANCVSKAPLHDKRNRSPQEILDVTNFTLESIQCTQSDDPELWQISAKDRHTFYNMESKGPRCNRCRHFGHFAIHCTEKPGPPPCYLCGGGDHQEPRCPNKLCTQCGTPGQYSTTYCGNCFKFRHTVCRMCQQKGHIEKTCPDLWRRYHLTTKRGPIVPATGDQLKPRNQRWCSGCGSQGHLEHECLHYQRLYPPSLPYIVNYDDVLTQADEAPPPQLVQPPEPQQPTVAIDPCFTNVLRNALSMELETQGAIPQQQSGIPSLLDIPVHVPNPFALALQKSVMPTPGSLALNELSTASISTRYTKMKIDITYITNYFMTAPGRKIQSFLQKEMVELDTCCNVNPKSMKSLLFRTERFYAIRKKSKYDKQRVAVGFRALNMFIFGHHQLRDGKHHVYYLRAFLNKKKCNLDAPKRKSLLSAYCYIFGPERHTTINYFGILRAIQQRYGNQEI